MDQESQADWYSSVRVKMTPNITMHRTGNSRLRRPLPAGDCARSASRTTRQ
jgi:hypothetical protein